MFVLLTLFVIIVFCLDVAVQELCRWQSRTYVDDHALLHVSASESGPTHHIVVAAQVIPPVDVVYCEPSVVRSPSCSDPDLDASDLDRGEWDASTVATVQSVAMRTRIEGMNSPSVLFTAKPNATTTTAIGSDGPTESPSTPAVTLPVLRDASPEVLRSACVSGNGSLVPAYGSTGIV